MGFVGNLSLFAAVKEFCKSIENWRSYRHGYGGTVFLTHRLYSYFQCTVGYTVKYIWELCVTDPGSFILLLYFFHHTNGNKRGNFNPFNASCSKFLLLEAFSACTDLTHQFWFFLHSGTLALRTQAQVCLSVRLFACLSSSVFVKNKRIY